MPVYEFRCNKCGHVESIFSRSVCSVSLSSCPKCESGEVSRVISGFAYHRSEKSRMGPWDMWCAKPGSWEEAKLHEMGMKTPRESLRTLYEAKKSDIEMFEKLCGKKAVEQAKVEDTI